MYMYVLHNKMAHNALRAVALLVVVALLAWIVGVAPFSHNASAANVTSFSDTLSNSDISAVSDHTIVFTLPSGMSIGQTFTITFPAGFDLSSVVIGDVDLATTTNETLAGAAGANAWGYSKAGQVLTFETPTNYGVGATTTMTVKIGLNAAGGANQIINPTGGSYEIDMAGTMADSGHTRVVIIDNVDVTARVTTSFTFTVTGLATSSVLNGTTTTRTSTATAIPFGTLSAGVMVTLAQRLNVTTNAKNGFVVTVAQSGNLQSSTGADIDGFIDGAYTNTPAAWVAPTNSIADENTWGHWGLTSADDIGTSEFISNKWVAASTTPRAIFSHTGPADGVQNSIGSTTVGYQVQITPLQEAGDDYNTTLTYVATPTF